MLAVGVRNQAKAAEASRRRRRAELDSDLRAWQEEAARLNTQLASLRQVKQEQDKYISKLTEGQQVGPY